MAASVWSRLAVFVDSLGVHNNSVAKSFCVRPHYIRPGQHAACSAGVQHAHVCACAFMRQKIKCDIHTDAKRDAKQD